MILQQGKMYYITNQYWRKHKRPIIILKVLSQQEYESHYGPPILSWHHLDQVVEMSYLDSNTSFVQIFSARYINDYFEEIK